MDILDKIFHDFIPLQKKKVRFSTLVYCVLIPSRSDIYYIRDELWWNSDEYDLFYDSCVKEIKSFIQNYDRGLSFKQGKDLLYQSRIYDFDDSYYN